MSLASSLFFKNLKRPVLGCIDAEKVKFIVFGTQLDEICLFTAFCSSFKKTLQYFAAVLKIFCSKIRKISLIFDDFLSILGRLVFVAMNEFSNFLFDFI